MPARVHVAAWAGALALLAPISWLGEGWGWFVLYAVVLLLFGSTLAFGCLGVARRGRAREVAVRGVRAFSRAQLSLAGALVAAALVARASSGPLGPFAGGAFEGVPSGQLTRADLALAGEEIALQVPADPPYTITTHAFGVEGSLYVGAAGGRASRR